MKNITFNRTELYEELWEKPMNQIAKEYKINVYQLTKVCDELEIPRPESGYWSKLRHGKKVKQKPLTELEKSSYTLRLDSVNPVELENRLPKGYKPFKISDQLRTPHPLVRKTHDYLKERSQGRSPGDDYGRLKTYGPGYLNMSVSKDSLKRAMRILDAILKESIRQGFQVGTETSYDRHYTYIQVGEDKAYISLQEEGKQIKTKIEKPKFSWEEYDYERYTNGRFKLSISSSYYGYSSRKISDTKTQTIEERLDKFFPILLEIIEEERVKRIKRKEEKRLAEINRKIREQKEREYQAEIKRREELEEQSKFFTKSEYIYQFIQEVESKINLETLDREQLDRFNEWKNWAIKHADRLNPVKQKIESILNPVEEEESKLHLW